MNLRQILEDHVVWVLDRTTGKYADFSNADLSGADLNNAPLERIVDYIDRCNTMQLAALDDLVFLNQGAIEDTREKAIIAAIASNRKRIDLEDYKRYYNQ